ncbi:hypothetical protein KC367_g7520 [Hortaea werneckii]|nr:hypothetical protein KC342_g11499 [Hortaea werneckii]KAI7099493.1 hypothetical protein KC339_g8167 [Hortaea werneckii]KAI7228605.1 hypothetical protein KC365_g8387 [Hortaea werneckii]KAI7307686.1 hypothetical protein KC340_g11269 [Hortaea werneckii]KAI7393496.1 hypothetical protein KC328_g6570 [Hortaea werneckii]
MRKAPTRIPRPTNPGHGRYIYAYAHTRTSQVLYSLTRNLTPSQLSKQLPDLGANHADSKLRKDLWQPFFTLCLPETESGDRQGLHAFKKLREYRKLHELSWKPSPLLSKPWTEGEIEELKQTLNNRGGNKKESVYDLIKREKKKMRVREVQDQKANSIADLAAVLLEQEDLGALTGPMREAEKKELRQKEVAEMLDLAAKADAGGLQKLGEEVAQMQTRIEELPDGQEDAVTGLSKTKLKHELYKMNGRKLRMEFSVNAVRQARDAHERGAAPSQTTASPIHSSTMTGKKKGPSNAITEYAKQLRALSHKGMHRGALRQLDEKIAATHQSLEDALNGNTEDVDIEKLQSRLLLNKVTKYQMELAVEATEAAQKEGRSTDLKDETPGIRVKAQEYKVQLLQQDVEDAQQRDDSEKTEQVEDMLTGAKQSLKFLKSVEGLSEEEFQRVEQTSRQRTASTEEELAKSETAASPAKSETAEGQQAEPQQLTEPDWMTLLPSFPGRDPSHIPKRGPLKQQLRRLNSPVFTTEGIKVQWSNMLDAEYAAQWPENVSHERMGWTRYQAPKPQDAEAADLDISGFKQKQWRNRSANWVPAAEEAAGEEAAGELALEGESRVAEEKGRAQFVEGVKERVQRTLRERREEEERRKRAVKLGLPLDGRMSEAQTVSSEVRV